MRIVNVVGARPNFIKVAPVHAALKRAGADAVLVHTGQHYDEQMSQVFFDELGMPRPDVNLGVGSGSHAVQTARILEAFEPVLLAKRPDLVLVAGDVNSTVAGALVAVKLGIPVAHLEAGLRSWDWSMPEEINRVLTDRMSAVLLTPSPDADENLLREGAAASRIFRVGNAMIDTLLFHVERARARAPQARFGLEPGGYALVTLHRPAAVDDRVILSGLVSALKRIAAILPVLLPAHPRTRARLDELGLSEGCEATPNLHIVEPLGYLDFLALEAEARLVLTDSGGVQEETTALGVPCLTLRENTERPITVTEGTNTIVGLDPERIVDAARETFTTGGKKGRVPEQWDGETAARVVEVLMGARGKEAKWQPIS